MLDEALYIPRASPPRGGLAASTLSTSTPAPGLDSCLTVPCEEERIPRCGRRPAKLIKFTLGLQLVCRKQKKFAQSSPVGLHKVAKSLHSVCNWCAGSQKKCVLSLPVSLHTVAISLHFVCTWFAIGLQEAEKFTCQFVFSSESLHWHRNVYMRGYQTAEKVYITAE